MYILKGSCALFNTTPFVTRFIKLLDMLIFAKNQNFKIPFFFFLVSNPVS